MDYKYISYEKKDDICLVHVTTSGYLNLEIGEEVFNLCKKLIDEGNMKLLLDLILPKMVNSIGVSMLIEQAVPTFHLWFGFEPTVDDKLIKKLNLKIK